MANLVFLPWLRRGLATVIARPDQDTDQPPNQLTAAGTTLALNVTTSAGDAPLDLPLIGPGDIAGLDARAIVRTTPGRDETDAEFKHFVSVEFDQADLPWRYSPAAPTGDHLRPWLTLLVLADNEWTPVKQTPDQKLPIAKITNGNALPMVEHGWACAHVQLFGAAAAAVQASGSSSPQANDAVKAALTGQPGQFVARLLNPRLLLPQTSYTAMLVPTYERGRRAGLGIAVDDESSTIDALKFAFNRGTAPIDLPIYYQWRFQTGLVGDFADLAARLAPQRAPRSLGRRSLDVSKPGFDLANASTTGTALPIEGALQSIENAAVLPSAVTSNWLNQIKDFVNRSVADVDHVSKILVTPPLYGRWHSGETRLNDVPPPPINRPWFFQLNSTPVNRAAAGLGTVVVEENQQALMASAWSQIEALPPANKQRKVLQLGRESLLRVFSRHFVGGSTDGFLLLTGALHRWVLTSAGNQTIHAALAGSVVGGTVFDPQVRRFFRPRGFIGNRQGRTVPGAVPPLAPVTWLRSGLQPAPPPPAVPIGMVTSAEAYAGSVPANLSPPRVTILANQGNDPLLFWGIVLFCTGRKLLASSPGRAYWWILQVLRTGIGLIRMAAGTGSTTLRVALRDGTLTGDQVRGGPKVPGFTAVSAEVPNPVPAPPPTGAADSADAVAARQAWADLIDAQHGPQLPPIIPTAIDLPATTSVLSTKLDPSVTLLMRAKSRLQLDAGIIWQPADPLEPVQADPEFPLPMWAPLRDLSLDWILPGVADVGANTVGAVVTNQRFIEAYMVGLNHQMARTLLWNEFPTDQRGTYFRQFWDSRGAQGSSDSNDIRFIAEWSATELGNHSPRTPPSALVLLVRADLIQRYPNVVVYSVPLPPGGGFPQMGATETFPIFFGRLSTDVAFYGFPFAPSASATTMFILQEQPAEPRFWLDVPLPPPNVPTFVEPADAGNAVTSAQFAAITFQDPLRVAIPGPLLVP